MKNRSVCKSKKIVLFITGALLGAFICSADPITTLAATTADEKAYELAQKAANEAYQNAIASGMSEAEAMSKAQEASESALSYGLSFFANTAEDDAAKKAEELAREQASQEAAKATEEALQKQLSAINAQTAELGRISDMVESFGKEEEEEEGAEIKVAETKTSPENPCITWYVKGIEQRVKQSEAFIDGNEIEIEQSGIVGDGDGPAPKTLLLVDNSSSMSGYKDKIKTILTRLVWNHQPQERFSLVVFGEDTTVLIDFTDNYDDVRAAIENMTYYDRGTYLRNILYDEIKAMNDDGEGDFNRIVIFSDGTDESRLGITYEELTDLVKSDMYKCPIYTIGCHYEPTAGDLDKLFALSRRSSSPYFAIDDYKNVEQIADGIREDDRNIRFFKFSLPEELMDGGQKTIDLHLVFEEEDIMFAHSTQAPVASAEVLRKVAEEKKKAGESELASEEDTEKETDDKIKDDEDDDIFVEEDEIEMKAEDVAFYYFFHNALWISLIFIVLYIAYVSYKGKQRKKISRIEEEERSEEAVQIDLGSDIRSEIYLFEVGRPDVKYPVKIGEEKVIGRSRARCDFSFPMDRAMSSRHACIRVTSGGDNRVILENLDTQGGTRVDGQVIGDDTVLRNGAKIKLGSTMLEVRYD